MKFFRRFNDPDSTDVKKIKEDTLYRVIHDQLARLK